MNETTVHNLIIVDASGSMDHIYAQALAGMNETIKTIGMARQKEPNIEQTLTLLSFADGGEPLQYIYRNEYIETAHAVGEHDYVLRGMTALYDAIGDSVTDLCRHVRSTDKVLVTIITDGYENDSRHWSGIQVKQLIDKLRSDGWVFTYIGANQDVEAVAKKMGVVNSLRFESTEEGTAAMFERENCNRLRWNERVSRGEEELEADYFADDETDYPEGRVTPEHIRHLAPHEVFVFGSNIAGRHKGGAARTARHHFGAMNGVGEGPQGQSYAIPTVGCGYRDTEMAVQRFILFAKTHPGHQFLVTPVGCGNGGWLPKDMARLFTDAVNVNNISLPKVFWQHLM